MVLNESTEIKHSPQFQLDAIRAHLIFSVNLHVLQLVEIQFVLLKYSPEGQGEESARWRASCMEVKC